MGKPITILAAFDGTGNHKDNDRAIKDDSQTNIAELIELYKNKENQVYYETGVGTEKLTDEQIELVKAGKEKKEDYYSSIEMGLAITAVKDKVKSMLEKVKEPIKDALKEGETINIDVAGFSRGATSARDFVNEFNKTYAKEIQSGKIVLNNVILFDTVATVGLANSHNEGLNLNLGEHSAKNIIHLTAKDEKRENFPLESLKDENGNLPSNIKEIELLGVHSDIGGGYKYSYEENIIVKSGFISQYSNFEQKKEQLSQEAKDLGLKVEFKEYSTTYKGTTYTQNKYSFIETTTITNDLSNISLQLVYDELVKNGANIKDISVLNKQIPNELIPYYNALKNGEDTKSFEAIVGKYIHNSAHNENEAFKNYKDKFIDWISNRDSDGLREIYTNEPLKAVNPSNPNTFNNEDSIKEELIENIKDYIKENHSVNVGGLFYLDKNSIIAIEQLKEYVEERFNTKNLDLSKETIEKELNTDIQTNEISPKQEKILDEKLSSFESFSKAFMEDTEPKEDIDKLQEKIQEIKDKNNFNEKIKELQELDFKEFTSNDYIQMQFTRYKDKIIEESTNIEEKTANTQQYKAYDYMPSNTNTNENRPSVQMMS